MITRVYNNLSYYTKLRLPSIKYEKYLVKWQPNHSTNIHWHDGKKCNFYLLKGEIKENKFVHKDGILVKDEETILNKFLDNRYIDDTLGQHSIENLSDTCSYSYHVYE